MRRNRRRGNLNQDYENKRLFYIATAITIIAIVTFIITYIIYSNTISNVKDKTNVSKINNFDSNKNEISFETSSSIGKSINEVKEDENKDKDKDVDKNIDKDKNEIENKNNEKETKKENAINNNVEKTVINTSNVTNKEKETKKEEVDSETKKQDPIFIKPVEGDIIREFAKDNLVYSQTLKEWITHTGIDIKAEKTTIVKASSEGTVESIKNDPRYGITVVIEHSNGFKSVYSNLMTAEFVKEGEKVNKGQTIGTVGNSASFEILDDSHLHFEILKDNNYLNPSEYIK